MSKQIISKTYILITISLLISLFVLAQPGKERIPSESKGGSIVIVPAHAVEVAEGIYSLGQAQDVDGRIVEGFMFIDNKKENANPNAVCGNGICEGGEKKSCPTDCAGGGEPPATSTCFSVFAKGARWKETEQYVTGAGIDTVVTETSLNTWDSEVSFDIFGPRNVSGVSDGRDEVSPDGKNEVDFDDLGAGGTIGVTIVWGIFIGPPSGRKLVEWDTSFNNQYPFGNYNLGDPTMMDYQNIATHEFGHSLGLSHPDDTCTEETMYRFADFNETKKRDLNSGDIAGVNDLY